MRRNFTRLRISAHNLAIETGRYVKSKLSKTLNVDKRLCFHCKDVESEYHLLFECNLYKDARSQLINRLHSFTSFPISGTNDNFCLLMSSLNGDIEVGRAICDYVNICFKCRSDTLSEIKENNILCRPATTITRSGRVSKRPSRIDV